MILTPQYDKSPNLRLHWKCDEGSGLYVKDYSGNGYHAGPLNAPVWKPNFNYGAAATFKAVTVIDNSTGLILELTSVSGGTASRSGATEPVMPAVAGTVVDGQCTWTARTPLLTWGASGVKGGTGPAGLLQIRQGGGFLDDFLGPVLKDGLIYTSTTLSATSTDGSFNDSAGTIPLGTGPSGFATGDWVMATGWPGTAANGVFTFITSVTANKMVVSGGTTLLVTDTNAGGSLITLKKVERPGVLMVSALINSAGGGNDWVIGDTYYGSGVSTGLEVLVSTTRALNINYMNHAGVTTNWTTGATVLPLNTQAHAMWVIDRVNAQAYMYVNGTRAGVTAFVVAARNQARYRDDATHLAQRGLRYNLFGNTSFMKEIQVYTAPAMPSFSLGFYTSANATLLNTLREKLAGGGYLTASDWGTQ